MTVCMVCRTAGSQHAPPQTATSNRSGKATHIVDTRPAVPRRKQVVRKSYSLRGSEAGHSVQTPTGPEKPRTSWAQSRPFRAVNRWSGTATHIVGPRPAIPCRHQQVRKRYAHRGSEAGHSVQTPKGPEKVLTLWARGRPFRADTKRTGKATHIVDPKPAIPCRHEKARQSYSHRGCEAGHFVQAIARKFDLTAAFPTWCI